jgi:hypothetical protein
MQAFVSKNGTNECNELLSVKMKQMYANSLQLLVSKNGTNESKLLTVKMEQMNANSCQ